MSCAEFEILLSDYVDNTLDQAQRNALEQHAAACVSCRQLMRDVVDAVSFLSRVERVTPPPALLTRIAFHIPVGRTREQTEDQGFFSRTLAKWFRPMLQPRWAMGMAMTLLSFAMLERCTGIQVQHIAPADLNPARIWDSFEDKAVRTKDRAVKYYENLRFVYEIETRLKEMRDQTDTPGDTQKTPQRSDAQSTPRTPDPKGGQKK